MMRTTKIDRSVFSEAGRKGGLAGRGAAKLRGDTDYYKRIGRKSAAARKKKAK